MYELAGNAQSSVLPVICMLVSFVIIFSGSSGVFTALGSPDKVYMLIICLRSSLFRETIRRLNYQPEKFNLCTAWKDTIPSLEKVFTVSGGLSSTFDKNLTCVPEKYAGLFLVICLKIYYSKTIHLWIPMI